MLPNFGKVDAFGAVGRSRFVAVGRIEQSNG
jgi:hypothetical protein